MAKTVFLNSGHGGSDPGACANGFKEKDLNLTITLACRDELKRHGVTVIMGRSTDVDRTSGQIIKACNSSGAELAIDIHNNAGGGDGAEVYYYSGGGKSKTLANNILTYIKEIGQNSRGAKTRIGSDGSDYYYFIRETSMPAVIVECAFVDNRTDMKIIDTTAEQKKMGVAIAKGILKTLGITYKATTTTTNSNKTTSSTTTSKPTTNTFKSYIVRITASNGVNIRKGAGTNYAIVGSIPRGGAYTIVAEKTGQGAKKWGKLKSGAGWIALDYTEKI